MGKCKAGGWRKQPPHKVTGACGEAESSISRRGTKENSTIHLPHIRVLPFLPLLDSAGCKALWANQGDSPYQQRVAFAWYRFCPITYSAFMSGRYTLL